MTVIIEALSFSVSTISNEVFANMPPEAFVKLPLTRDPGMLNTSPNSGFIPTVTVSGSNTSRPLSRLAKASYSPGTIPVW